jgi:heterotetrameric sarcosine oxidase delta subunit
LRIACPYCGGREIGEFTYLGDAKPKRPAVVPGVRGDGAPGEEESFFDYIYLRDNLAGQMSEYWYHGGGCRSWLIVERSTLTHEINSVRAAPGAGAAEPEAK